MRGMASWQKTVIVMCKAETNGAQAHSMGIRSPKESFHPSDMSSCAVGFRPQAAGLGRHVSGKPTAKTMVAQVL